MFSILVSGYLISACKQYINFLSYYVIIGGLFTWSVLLLIIVWFELRFHVNSKVLLEF